MLYKAAVAYDTYQLEAGATAPMNSVGKDDCRADDKWRRQRLGDERSPGVGGVPLVASCSVDG